MIRYFLIISSIVVCFSSCTKEYYIDNEEISSIDADINTINVVERSMNNPNISDVIPNDGIDDSVGIQEIIDDNPGKVLFFESGVYDIHSSLYYSPHILNDEGDITNAAGLKMVGDGVENTIFDNKTGGYAIKVLGISDETGRLKLGRFQSNGFFRDFTIRGLRSKRGSAPKGGIMLIAANGFEIENVYIYSYNLLGHKFTEHAIYVPIIENILENGLPELTYETEAQFHARNKDKIYEFTINEHGSTTYDRIMAGPDFYYTTLVLDKVRIQYTKGYGIFGENGVGFRMDARNLRLTDCEKAGLYLAGHNSRFVVGAVANCGSNKRHGLDSSCLDEMTGGIIVDRLHAVPNGFVIEDVEFDGNYPNHIQIRSSANARIKNNRFLMHLKYNDVNGCPGDCNYERVAGIKLGAYYWYGDDNDDFFVRNTEITNNYFHYDVGDQFFSMDLANRVKFSVIDNNQSSNIQPGYNTLNLFNDLNENINFCLTPTPAYSGNMYYVRSGFTNSFNGNYVRHNGEVLID